MAYWLTCIDTAVTKNLFAVGRADGTVVLSALSTGRPRWVERLHDQRVAAVAFHDVVLWTAGFDGKVVAWDLELGEVRTRFDAGHGRVLSMRVDGDALVTVGDDGYARLWDAQALSPAQMIDEHCFGPAYAVALTPDWIAIGYESDHVGAWRPSVPAASMTAAGWQYEGKFQPAGRGPLYAVAGSSSRPGVVRR